VKTMFAGDLAKAAIAFVGIDRFYRNLVICLQLDISL